MTLFVSQWTVVLKHSLAEAQPVLPAVLAKLLLDVVAILLRGHGRPG